MSADTLNAETWRFDAYYYGFTPTGVAPVDLVLSAVATAGKAFHHTESWNDEAKLTAAPNLRGGTPVEWIQNAALDAAAALRAAEARIKALDWLADQKQLSVGFYSPFYCDDDDQSREWRVHRETGSINDREWEIVGRGATPLDAIEAAAAALSPAPEEKHDER